MFAEPLFLWENALVIARSPYVRLEGEREREILMAGWSPGGLVDRMKGMRF